VPARSYDLNPPDSGNVETPFLVYSEAVNDLKVLQQRVENACQEI